MTAEVRNAKWVFTMQVKTHTLVVHHDSMGQINVLKVELIDNGEACKVVCYGRLAGAPGYQANTMRTAPFNVNNYRQYPPAPPELIALLQKHAFAKTEVA